jgi:hypothetical protein
MQVRNTQAGDYAKPATERELEAVANKLRERNFEVVLVDDAKQAHDEVMKRLPEGAEVHSAKSKTLEDIGVFQELMESERFDFIRKKYVKMDRKTQMREIRKMVAAPDYELGSVNAITQDGQMILTSASGSQIGPYGGSAENLIVVAGSQKIVPNLETALRRVHEHVFPYEDARLREQMGVGTKAARILIIERDFVPGRTTVILVRKPVGV